MSDEIEKPLILGAAARLFKVDTRWLRKRAEKGDIRSKKVGYHTIVDEDDVRRVAEERHLVEQALKRQRELERELEEKGPKARKAEKKRGRKA